MKRAWQAVGLTVLTLLLVVASGKVSFSRVTTASNTDVWCSGPSGREVCVDTDGNFVPTTDNDTTLGSSSLRWATVYALDQTIGDDLTVTDDATITDDLAVNGDTTLGDASGDTLVLNLTTVTVRADANGIRIGTSTTDGTYILSLDGSNRRLGINTNAAGATLDVTALNGSSTGTIVNTAASQTADALQIKNSGGVVRYQIGAQGHVRFSTYTMIGINTLVPDFQGAQVQVINYTSLGAMGTGNVAPTGTYLVCTATGTAAADWAVAKGTNGVNQNGCGTGL